MKVIDTFPFWSRLIDRSESINTNNVLYGCFEDNSIDDVSFYCLKTNRLSTDLGTSVSIIALMVALRVTHTEFKNKFTIMNGGCEVCSQGHRSRLVRRSYKRLI